MWSREQMLNYVHKDIEDYFKQTVEATRLSVLSQRYNKYCKRLGMRPIDLVESDPDLVYKLTKTGARIVMSRSLLEKAFGDDRTSLRNWWMSQGVPTIHV